MAYYREEQEVVWLRQQIEEGDKSGVEVFDSFVKSIEDNEFSQNLWIDEIMDTIREELNLNYENKIREMIENITIPHLRIRDIIKRNRYIEIDLQGGSSFTGQSNVPDENYVIYANEVSKIVNSTGFVLSKFDYNQYTDVYFMVLTTRKYL